MPARGDSYYQALLTRLVALHHAYCEQQRRYNLGLHTPGVLPHVEGELRVHPVGGLTVRVEPGAALDARWQRAVPGRRRRPHVGV